MLKILFGKQFAVLLAHTVLYETKLREAQKTSVPKISLLLSLIKRAEIGVENIYQSYMTHSQMLGKFEYTGGPIFKVVLEC